MPAASKDATPVSVDEEILEGRYAELGGYTVGFETFRADADLARLFRGLPDDRCQCPHWGHVVSGYLFSYPGDVSLLRPEPSMVGR